MPKYRTYGLFTASKSLGEVEADTPDKAREKAFETGDSYVQICHQCSREIDLGDMYDVEVELIE